MYSRYAIQVFSDVLSILIRYISFKLLKCISRVIVRLCSKIYHRIIIEISCEDYRTVILTAQAHKILLHREKYREDSVRVIPKYYNRKREQKRKNRGFTPLEGKIFNGVAGRPPTTIRQ